MGLIKKPNELDVNVRIKMLIYGQPGAGKAQPLFSKVLTPNGYVPMGEIKVGDELLSVKGGRQVVEGVFPQGVRPYYRIVTNDGCVCYCDEEHIWTVRNSKGNSRKAGWRNMTLSQMLEKGIMCPNAPSRVASGRKPIPRFEIPVAESCDFAAKDLPIDPYILGVLIGDGTLVGSVAAFSNPDMDSFIHEEVARRLSDEYELTRHDSVCPQYTIAQKNKAGKNGFKKKISSLLLDVHSGDKFIPAIYLSGSKEQRLDLLRGLMDTDGSCSKNRTSYSTTSAKLAADIVALVRSLGGVATTRYYEREDKDCDCYEIRIRMSECPFLLERKASEWSATTQSRYIVMAEFMGYTPCQCIKVSDDTELYITDDFIVTHNTTLALSAPKPLLVDFDNGINRVDYEFIKDTVQVQSYADILNLLNNEDLTPYETLVIDTGGKLLDCMAEYLIASNPRLGKRNGSLTLEGYGVRKVEFTQLLKLINSKKKHVVFVAHRTTEKNGDDTRYVPLFGGSNYDSLATELDLVGYLVAEGNKRIITFDPCQQSEGKNTCNLPAQMDVPYLKNDNREVVGTNDFLEKQVFKRYIDRLKERSVEGETYKKLIVEIEKDIAAIKTAEDATAYIKKVEEYKHVGNSKAIARNKFVARTKELGLTFDTKTKTYSAPVEDTKKESAPTAEPTNEEGKNNEQSASDNA